MDHHNVHNVPVDYSVIETIFDGMISLTMVTIINATRDTFVKKAAKYQIQPAVQIVIHLFQILVGHVLEITFVQSKQCPHSHAQLVNTKITQLQLIGQKEANVSHVKMEQIVKYPKLVVALLSEIVQKDITALLKIIFQLQGFTNNSVRLSSFHKILVRESLIS